MKIIFLLIVVSMAACTQGARSKPGTVVPSSDPNSNPSRANGGIDVGNMHSSIVPLTMATIVHPSDWQALNDGRSLTLDNNKGSTVRAEAAEIGTISRPSPELLVEFLKKKNPQWKAETIEVNGLKGARIENRTASQAESEAYLISEKMSLIRLTAKLTGDGIAAGEKILKTVRIKYLGKALPSAPRQVTLMSYSLTGSERMRAAYSVQSDCFSYVDRSCRGVSILFGNSYDNRISVGNAGGDTGRIIDLGPDKGTRYDSIRVDGQHLMAQEANVSLDNIYIEFTRANPQVDQSEMNLKEGHVYLIRTISWPDEDLLFKVRVDRLVDQQSVTLTYDKIATVDSRELEQKVAEENNYTLKHEQPQATGERLLFDRSHWRSYRNSAFNFYFATSGNLHITNNSWDLYFEQGQLSVPHSSSAIGEVFEVKGKALADVQLSDFPDPNTYSRHSEKAVEGKVYGVYHYSFGGITSYDWQRGRVIRGAVEVVKLDASAKTILIRYRRISITEVDHFQKWTVIPFSSSVESVTVGRAQKFKLGDGERSYFDQVYLQADGDGKPELNVDPRPFGNAKGFIELSDPKQFDTITAAEVASLRGKMTDRQALRKGAVIAMSLENYYDWSIYVVRVDELNGDKVTFSVRKVFKAKTPFSRD